MVNIETQFKTLFFNGLLRYFALRNDDMRIPSLREISNNGILPLQGVSKSHFSNRLKMTHLQNSSLRACEAIQKKQNIKIWQNNSIGIASCATNTSRLVPITIEVSNFAKKNETIPH